AEARLLVARAHGAARILAERDRHARLGGDAGRVRRARDRGGNRALSRRLARRPRAELVPDPACLARAVLARRAEQSRASVLPRSTRGARRAARARRACRLSLATRRGRDRKGRVVDESRSAATPQRLPRDLTTVVT